MLPNAKIPSELQAVVDDSKLDVFSEEFAQEMDSRDELRSFRDKFYIPPSCDKSRKDSLYLCGNSLGCQPRKVEEYVMQDIVKWRNEGVEGHHSGKLQWLTVDEYVKDHSAAIVGAKPVETIIMNTLTVNLHMMMIAFYRPTATRHKILVESKAFPSDQYAVQSQLRLHGYTMEDSLVEVAPRDGETTVRTEDILAKLEAEGDSIALVMICGLHYYTGEVFDMEAITRAGHAKGCKVGFDLAHAVGNVPLRLHDWGVDFAVWCTYKYLNSGPGGIGGAFVHERYAEDKELFRLQGWWGHRKEDRFKMRSEFHPAPGAAGFQLSNPPVFATTPLRASLEVTMEAGMDRLRAKSVRLTGYLELLLDSLCAGHLHIITPRDPSRRGAQLSLVFNQPVKPVFDKLNAAGVICDMREPDVMRIAPTPLYNSFQDVYDFVTLLRDTLTAADSAAPASAAKRQKTGETA